MHLSYTVSSRLYKLFNINTTLIKKFDFNAISNSSSEQLIFLTKLKWHYAPYRIYSMCKVEN